MALNLNISGSLMEVSFPTDSHSFGVLVMVVLTLSNKLI